ncbi:uncharacterized protein LOC128301553 [Anopheles moucheti]|uniref:uncharacterized protein LOC128301553 n=1 Tax=Anopheles moucheti TaxID=186751 RepID=UPI0022F13C0E|nr:uncharacterized protein LOC128301553 [Anopheles moucheti]
MERKEEKEKVKAHRKRSGEHHPLHSTRRETLPTPPPDPTTPSATADGLSHGAAACDTSASTGSYAETDPFKRLFTYREREAQFLRLLCESDPAQDVAGAAGTAGGAGGGIRKPPGPGYAQPGSGNAKEGGSGVTGGTDVMGRNEPGFESVNEFLMLLNRAGPSVAAALSTKDAIDQLDRLHELIGQFLTLQEQNMRMHWQLKNVETLRKLKLMQISMAKDPEAFIINSGGLPEDTSDNDLLDNEIEQNLALLETILAAGNSASSKRSSSKRERSKSVINDEITNFQLHRKESGGRNYPLRRQSAVSDFKPKVSKWTKVKAAFKWEKTSALPANELKSSEAMMIPVNNEVARYLRVPSIPCVGSSGDSVFSSSSGIVVSGGSAPGTPGENSLASSAENLTDMNEDTGGASGSNRGRHGKRDSVKSTERSSQEEDARRSRSLDGDAILEPIRQMDKNKNKSAWSKVKGIVKNHRGSLKSNESRRDAKPSNSVGCSREASPCESMDACEMVMQRDRSDSFSSSQTSPGHRTSAMAPTFLLLPAIGSVAAGDNSAPSGPNSPCGSIPGTQATFSSGEDGDWKPSSIATDGRIHRNGSGDKGIPPGAPTTAMVAPGTSRGSRKSKHIPDIESVPEGVPVETRSPVGSTPVSSTNTNTANSSSSISKLRKSPPKPLSLTRQPDSIEVALASEHPDGTALSLSSSPGPKCSPKRKSYAGISLDPDGSLPGSPSGKQFGFFAGAERVSELVEPGYSSGDVSDQNTPKRRPSPKHRTLQRQREEIERRYQELQLKLQREFDAKQQEWERIRPAALLLNNSPLLLLVNQLLKEEAAGGHGACTSKSQPPPIVEDNLTPDFKKKLNEWRTKHQPGTSKESMIDTKKKPITDWQLWKTGQIKLEGQGLKQLPDAKDLPEDFQKKLSEWKQMKAANKVPPYTTQSSQGGSSEGGSSMKRQQSKASGSAVKKSKTSDELEKDRHQQQQGLSKLKALVTTSETPKKELVVQTTKGFIRFEGISRKFTRKLFEWEKAKGIGPEASTIALLHPGYAPVVVETRGVVLENKREKSPALARSLSMDSIAPVPSASSISHQPSSLSLNDADELKDVDKDSGSNRRVSSNPELELSAEREEPGAVLVEVEDEVLEVADPLMPVLPDEERRQSATLGVNQKTKESGYSSRPSSNSSSILKDSTKLLIRLSEQDSVDRDEVRRLKIVLRALIATLPEFVETGSRNSIAFFAYMKDLALDILRYLHRFDDGTLKDAGEVLSNVQTINGAVAELKKSLHSYMKYATANAGGRKDEDIPQISITPAVGAQATTSIQRTEDSFRSMATINVTPTFVCNAVRVNTVELVQPNPTVHRFPASSESEPAPLTSQSPDSSAYTAPTATAVQCCQCKDSPEKEPRDTSGKKLQRNLSNGSRRKARIKRMGSRQSSKTESDSDDSPQNYVLDVPRKTKRKTSRAKKPASDSTEKLPTATASVEKGAEDVVYVLKIKPGQKIEQVERPQPQNASIGMVPAGGEDVLISPQETCVELLEVTHPSVTEQTAATAPTSVLVKTKRKIFTTVESECSPMLGSGSANQPVAFSQELESGSGASDRNDAPETVVNVVLSPSQEQKLVTNLPPLPQSPGMQRRMDASKAPNKELSPNIRLMIAKYNQRLTTEKGGASPHSSGSCSPVAWRSPVLDRRVRKQTEKYQETIQLSKSASAGSLRKSLKQLEEEKRCELACGGPTGTTGGGGFGDDRDRTRVVKSFSASKIEGTSKTVMEQRELPAGHVEKEPSPELGTFLACDSLRRRDTLSRLERTREQQAAAKELSSSVSSSLSCQTATNATGTIRKERLYKKRTESPIAVGATTGSMKKGATRSEKYTRCRSVPNEECATEVLISSKALKPPSPRLIARRRLNLEQQRTELSRSAPTTPLEENRSILVPLSQRALKLKKAKEEFLRAPTGNRSGAVCSDTSEVWSNRISQISATSTASSSVVEGELTLLMKSASAGVIGVRSSTEHDTLRRNESGSSCIDGEGTAGSISRHSISTASAAGVAGGAGGSIAPSSSGSRFGGLSNLASKLRKVKLRRSSKDLSKMHAISALCRQSLMVDISGEAAAKLGSAQSLGSPRRTGHRVGEPEDEPDGEPLKKSGSVQAICNRFRRSGERNEELKKSRSLGFLEPERNGSG